MKVESVTIRFRLGIQPCSATFIAREREWEVRMWYGTKRKRVFVKRKDIRACPTVAKMLFEQWRKPKTERLRKIKTSGKRPALKIAEVG